MVARAGQLAGTAPFSGIDASMLGEFYSEVIEFFFETQRHRDTERATSVNSVSPCFQSPRKIGCLICGSLLKHRVTEAQRERSP